jgi:hypothetical protein
MPKSSFDRSVRDRVGSSLLLIPAVAAVVRDETCRAASATSSTRTTKRGHCGTFDERMPALALEYPGAVFDDNRPAAHFGDYS